MSLNPPGTEFSQGVECPRPLRADARRNRERILAAAREVFGDSGADAQVDDVARAAGVGVGTVYRHFPTKEELIGEIVRQTFARFADRARDALDADGDAFQALAWLLRSNAEQLAGDGATRYAMGSGTAVWEAASAERGELERLTQQLIDRGRKQGSLREDLTVADIGMVMCGLSSGIGRGFDWRRHLELVLAGLRGPAMRREGSS
jgi:AcrR family transcriptional regulator